MHRLLRCYSTILVAPRDILYQRKLDDLLGVLATKSNPSRVWAYYVSLLNYLGYHKLPLTIHQNVLRNCTPPADNLRLSVARRLLLGKTPQRPHLYESRLQTVVRNIRAMDIYPSLDDYNFILEQFAAVAHHIGVIQVYKEILRAGLSPGTKTYGLCLQAIAHRLALPAPVHHRKIYVSQCRRMLHVLLRDMRKQGKQFTSVNLDLTLRILKDTFDLESFEAVMRWGYGIDLSNPDCAPLEYTDRVSWANSLSLDSDSIPELPKPLYFSTPALNTTIDILGRIGNISKMVQAFEVLTSPLPDAQQHRASSSFDDDEDDFGVSVDTPSPPFKPPTASPNITTYNILLRHICRANNAVLARHYLMQAYKLEEEAHRKTVTALYGKPLYMVLSPHFMINRGTLVPLLGQTNRDKNLSLMRWVSRKVHFLLQRKRRNLTFFTNFRHGLAKRGVTPSDASPPQAIPPLSPSSKTGPESQETIFEANLDDQSAPDPAPVKYLDLDLHIRISERNITELAGFYDYLEGILGRTIQRVKERLTRRIWEGKNIYLTTRKRRGLVDKQDWHRMVNFKPRRSDPTPPQSDGAQFRRPWTRVF